MNTRLTNLVLLLLPQVWCWDTKFKWFDCYQEDVHDRMPLSIDNLIGIVEAYERKYVSTSAEDLAAGLLKRYKTNGIIFKEELTAQWSAFQQSAVSKETLDKKLLKFSNYDLEQDSFDHREECSLHMMVSHSVDYYPHDGADYIWDNLNLNSEPTRKKRASYIQKDGEKIADHPIEFGVIQTEAGPIATSLLLAGIMSKEDQGEYSIEDLLGEENAQDLPKEMRQTRIKTLYGATVSGILGAAAIEAGRVKKSNTFQIGPIGRFGNSTACPRTFTHHSPDFTSLTRAQIFGALDGFIIASYLQNSRATQSIKLSQILRMYYGQHGLYSSQIRACNRKNVFNAHLDEYKDEMRQQASNYMYAYQEYVADVKSLVVAYQDDFDQVESTFNEFLDDVFPEFSRFMSSYSYDDPYYFECGSNSLNYDDDDENIQHETLVDLLVIYTPTSTPTQNEKQAQFISLTARKLGVGYHRSKLAVLNGANENFVSPMQNHSNIADYACKYTSDVPFSGGSSSQDFKAMFEALTEYYTVVYDREYSDQDHPATRAQVVLWNLPNSFDNAEEEEKFEIWNEFNSTFPSVYFIFAGSSKEPVSLFYDREYNNEDELIYIDTKITDVDKIADQIVDEVRKAPRMFVYPGCNLLEDYNEGSHKYQTYVSPNFTNFIKISSKYFHFSEELILRFSSNEAKICISRTIKNPVKTNENNEDEIECSDTDKNPEFTYNELCTASSFDECDDIYISITGHPNAIASCATTNENCQYPNQLEVEMTHEGMICAGCGLKASFSFIIAVLLLLQNLKQL